MDFIKKKSSRSRERGCRARGYVPAQGLNSSSIGGKERKRKKPFALHPALWRGGKKKREKEQPYRAGKSQTRTLSPAVVVRLYNPRGERGEITPNTTCFNENSKKGGECFSRLEITRLRTLHVRHSTKKRKKNCGHVAKRREEGGKKGERGAFDHPGHRGGRKLGHKSSWYSSGKKKRRRPREGSEKGKRGKRRCRPRGKGRRTHQGDTPPDCGSAYTRVGEKKSGTARGLLSRGEED